MGISSSKLGAPEPHISEIDAAIPEMGTDIPLSDLSAKSSLVFPYELLYQILSSLSDKDLVIALAVNRQWRNLVEEVFFNRTTFGAVKFQKRLLTRKLVSMAQSRTSPSALPKLASVASPYDSFDFSLLSLNTTSQLLRNNRSERTNPYPLANVSRLLLTYCITPDSFESRLKIFVLSEKEQQEELIQQWMGELNIKLVEPTTFQVLAGLFPVLSASQQQTLVDSIKRKLDDKKGTNYRAAAIQEVATIFPFLHETQKETLLDLLQKNLREKNEFYVGVTPVVAQAIITVMTNIFYLIPESKKSTVMAALEQTLDDEDYQIQLHSIEELTKLFPNITRKQQSLLLPRFKKILISNGFHIEHRIKILGKLFHFLSESQKKEVVRHLKQLLNHNHYYVREAAHDSLTSILKKSSKEQQLEIIMVMLKIKERLTLYWFEKSFIESNNLHGSPQQALITHLNEKLNDEDIGIREIAATKLFALYSGVKTEKQKLIAFLRNALKDPLVTNVRIFAIRTLSQLYQELSEKQKKEFLVNLQEKLHAQDMKESREAIRAMTRLNSDLIEEEFFVVLQQRLDHTESWEESEVIIEALTVLYPKLLESQKQEFIAILQRRLRIATGEERWQAIRALTQLYPHLLEPLQQALMVVLQQSMADTFYSERYKALKALLSASPHLSEPQQQALVISLQNNLMLASNEVRHSVVEFLIHFSSLFPKFFDPNALLHFLAPKLQPVMRNIIKSASANIAATDAPAPASRVTVADIPS